MQNHLMIKHENKTEVLKSGGFYMLVFETHGLKTLPWDENQLENLYVFVWKNGLTEANSSGLIYLSKL